MSELILCEVGETGLDDLESYSPFCVKVHRALRAAGLAYSSRHGRHPGEFTALNPTGQVPVLLVGDEPVFDSTVILDRIETLAGHPFAGDLDARTAAEARLWEDFADTSVNGFVVASRWADDANWPRAKTAFFAGAPKLVCALFAPRLRKKVVARLVSRDVWRAGPTACWLRFEAMLEQLERRAPDDGFWIADRITAADLALFAQLHSLRCPITPRQAEMVASRHRLSRYLDRVHEATRTRRPISRRTPARPRMQGLVALLSS